MFPANETGNTSLYKGFDMNNYYSVSSLNSMLARNNKKINNLIKNNVNGINKEKINNLFSNNGVIENQISFLYRSLSGSRLRRP